MSRNRGDCDSTHFTDWLNNAHEDLEAAKILIDNNKCEEIAAFHCQQCIEKALKSYLLYKRGRHFDGHNLTFLCRQAASVDNHFYRWLDESAALNRYYIETRYPSDVPVEITLEKVIKIYTMAKNTYDFIYGEIYINF